MTPLAPHITTFLLQRLPVERGASPHTCDSYADAFRLLLEYASNCLKIPPSQLHLEHLDASLIGVPSASGRGAGRDPQEARG
jgi:site-specific recombinase XerC